MTDLDRFRSMFGVKPTEEELEIFVTRLAILCGSREPTRDQIVIATNEVREFRKMKEIYGN